MATAWTISAKSSTNISKEWEDVPSRWQDYSYKFGTNDWTILKSTKAQEVTES